MRSDEIRTELRRLVNQRPFQRFVINFENGDRPVVEHPENVAFDPSAGGSIRLYLITGNLTLHSTFDAVTSLVLQDSGQAISP